MKYFEQVANEVKKRFNVTTLEGITIKINGTHWTAYRG